MEDQTDSAEAPRHVAVYGSLRRDHGILPRLVPDGRLSFMALGQIRGVLYDLGPYPGLAEGPGRVAAEIYRIRAPETLAVLDDYEDFDPRDAAGSMFLRRAVRLVRPRLTAWAYFYNGPVTGRRKIPGGDWNAYTGIRA